MSEDFNAVLDGEQVEPEITEEPTEEAVDAAEPTEEPKEVPEPDKEPEGKTTVPKENEWTLTAVMDEREKRQKAVEEAERLRKELEALKPKEGEVSVFEDEASWNKQQEKKFNDSLRNTALNMSQAFAEEVFGEEEVAAATAWMQNEGIKSPYVLGRFNEAKLPFHEAVKMYRAEQERSNPDVLRAKLKEEILAELNAGKSKEKPATDITPSLATSGATGERANRPVESFGDLLGE